MSEWSCITGYPVGVWKGGELFGVGKKVHTSEVRSAMRVECGSRANVKGNTQERKTHKVEGGIFPTHKGKTECFS